MTSVLFSWGEKNGDWKRLVLCISGEFQHVRSHLSIYILWYHINVSRKALKVTLFRLPVNVKQAEFRIRIWKGLVMLVFVWSLCLRWLSSSTPQFELRLPVTKLGIFKQGIRTFSRCFCGDKTRNSFNLTFGISPALFVVTYPAMLCQNIIFS